MVGGNHIANKTILREIGKEENLQLLSGNDML